MALDSFYYENILDNNLNKYMQKIGESIETAIEKLKADFKKLEISYFFRGPVVIFTVERINTYIFDLKISYETTYYCYEKASAEEIGEMFYRGIKFKILNYWDNKILKQEDK